MTNILDRIAISEKTSVEILRQKRREGTVVVPLNSLRSDISRPTAVGDGLRVKVNANIGGSPDLTDIGQELEKLKVAVECGADTVMDLTIGGSWQDVLTQLLRVSPVPVGTVPVYGVIGMGKDINDLTEDDFIGIIARQAEMGVDFMTIHSGITREVAAVYDDTERTGGIVSRGGKLIYRWIKCTGRENPLYERFDDILDIAKRYNVTLSLGDGLRPGCLADASDAPQYAELEILGKLASRCREKEVSVMIEGPGHVPLDKIEENIRKEKEICNGAPFYVLGPLTTDIAAGYDHITGAIGGAVAAWKGADFLCYLTPAEHLHLPSVRDVYEGVMAARIAAHSGDIAKNLPGARDVDDDMSAARKKLDWDAMESLALDGRKIKDARKDYPARKDGACSMCGEYCALIEAEKN
ncbi:MAG: phosphomethylpyrimidine synthase ThiC [Elusimicrobiota bacterium]